MDWHQVIELRSEPLTAFFKIAPLLASDYFYIGTIALGYRFHPNLAKTLGFLVPFSTLLNCLLKNIFEIPRPPLEFHLVPVLDPFGFPSGDVMLGTVFWSTVFLYFNKTRLRFLCAIPITTMALSRIYFGVHSLFDVVGGFMFAMLTLYVWNRHLKNEQNILTSPYKFSLTAGVTFVLYALVSYKLAWSPMVPIALGALIGFYYVLYSLHKESWILPLISLAGAFLIGKMKPLIEEPFLLYPLIMLKYALLIVGVFSSVSYFVSKIRSKT